MTKMVGFIKFNNGCVKADAVVAIERYLDVMVKTLTYYRVVVHLANGVVLKETLKTEAEMEERYKEVCEQISECVTSAHTPIYEVD